MAQITSAAPTPTLSSPHPLPLLLAHPLAVSSTYDGPLDIGIRVGPIWPIMPVRTSKRRRIDRNQFESDSVDEENNVDADETNEPINQHSWQVTNQRHRAPWFCVSELQCIQAPSTDLHPYMFMDAMKREALISNIKANSRSAANKLKKSKTNSNTTPNSFSSPSTLTAAAVDDEMVDDEARAERAQLERMESDATQLAFSPSIGRAPESTANDAMDSKKALASNPLSISSQLSYFATTVGGGKRFRLDSKGKETVETPFLERSVRTSNNLESSLADLEEECANFIPDSLLSDLLNEDEKLVQSELREDLLGDRLAVVHSSVLQAWVAFPTGPLMDQIALGSLTLDSTASGASTATILHSIPVDSTIRQLFVATLPPPSDDDLNDASSHSTPLMPLIVTRTCYQLLVHFILFQSPNTTSSADATSSSSPQLVSLDSHHFLSPIVDMAPNPFIPNEFVVFLQDGSIWLWNFRDLKRESLLQLQFGGNVIEIIRGRRTLTQFAATSYTTPGNSINFPIRWGRITFAPNPRTLLVFLQDAIIQVDIRVPYTPRNTGARGIWFPVPSLLRAPNQQFASTYLREPDPTSPQPRIYAASIHPRHPFQYILVTSDFIHLCDIRHAHGSKPLLTWVHHQTGEPPAHIEWIRTGRSDTRIGHARCSDCTEEDFYFITHNRQRQEVTLYHYSMAPTPTTAAPMTHGHSTAFSSFNPLRLQSISHAEQKSQSISSSVLQLPDSSQELSNALASVRIIPASSPVPNSPSSNLWHLVQLSEYGALILQTFQHRHDDQSQINNSTITPIRQQSDNRQHSQSRTQPPQRIATNSSPTPTLSPSPTRMNQQSPTGELSSWMLPQELRPFHAVNLKGLMEKCTDKLTNTAQSSTTSSTSYSKRVSFSHMLASMIRSFNESSSLLYTYLTTPKTLFELTSFVMDQPTMLNERTKELLHQFGVHTSHPAPADTTPASASPPTRQSKKAIPKLDRIRSTSKHLTIPELHLLAHLVASTLHAFVYIAGTGGQNHPPYHMERWTRTTKLIRPTIESKSVDERSESSSEEEDGGDDDTSLDPYSDSFPQPSFAITHYHLSLERFDTKGANKRTRNSSEGDHNSESVMSEADEQKTPPPSSPTRSSSNILACTCTTSAIATQDSCCCLDQCAASHCLRLHSSVYAASPTILQLPWTSPAYRGLTFDDATVQLHPFQMTTPHPSMSHFATPHKPPPTLPIHPDLSQDISFLLSQSSEMLSQDQLTQPIPEESTQDESMGESKEDIKFSPYHPPSRTGSVNDAASASNSDAPHSVPPDPHALQDMLFGLSQSWQEAERVCQQILSHRLNGANQRGGDGDEEMESVDLTTLETELSNSNVDLFMRGLISHELAVDPNAVVHRLNEFGEDLRGSLLDEMEDRAGADQDD